MATNQVTIKIPYESITTISAQHTMSYTDGKKSGTLSLSSTGVESATADTTLSVSLNLPESAIITSLKFPLESRIENSSGASGADGSSYALTVEGVQYGLDANGNLTDNGIINHLNDYKAQYGVFPNITFYAGSWVFRPGGGTTYVRFVMSYPTITCTIEGAQSTYRPVADISVGHEIPSGFTGVYQLINEASADDDTTCLKSYGSYDSDAESATSEDKTSIVTFGSSSMQKMNLIQLRLFARLFLNVNGSMKYGSSIVEITLHAGASSYMFRQDVTSLIGGNSEKQCWVEGSYYTFEGIASSELNFAVNDYYKTHGSMPEMQATIRTYASGYFSKSDSKTTTDTADARISQVYLEAVYEESLDIGVYRKIKDVWKAGREAYRRIDGVWQRIADEDVLPFFQSHLFKSGHDKVAIAGYQPTCTETGMTVGYTCSICGKVITPQEVIPALGHAWIAATCTTPQICSTCGATGVPALGHIVTTLSRKEPTCGSTGLTEGSYCSRCGATLVAQQVIPATGEHTYTVVNYLEKCSVCGFVPTPVIYSTVSTSSARLSSQDSGIGDNASVSTESYILIAGGYNSSYTSAVDAFNASLTHTNPSSLSSAKTGLSATKVGEYALFGGGSTSSNSQTTVDAYNASLTRSAPISLSVARTQLSATNIGGYGLFAGGYLYQSSSTTMQNSVDAYNVSLTRTNPSSLSTARSGLGAISIGNYAVFAGGTTNRTNPSSSYVNAVDAYDTSLTRTNPAALSTSGVVSQGATISGDYALFATYTGSVNAYNSSLTRSVISSLSANSSTTSTTLGNYALFTPQSIGSGSVLDIYSPSLTKTCLDCSAVDSVTPGAAGSIGNYAVFSGSPGIIFTLNK